ncbi:hypothetical protein [Leptospira wolffii]|uniref:hypothetical protein n=1 Tax=Leptospira wolffii TaxID=409998 RepID=UPI000F654FB0|nr:hypothetical protein [Leptospira wolffii]
MPKSALSIKGSQKPSSISKNPVPGGSCSAMDPALKPTGKNGSFTPYNKRTPELKAGKPTKPKEMRMMPPKLKNAAIDIAEGVSAASKEGFEILTCVGAGAAGGSCNSKLLYNMRGPDYVNGQFGVPLPVLNGRLGIGINYTIDNKGGEYGATTQSINTPSKGFAGGINMGWILQINDPEKAELNEHLTGEGYGFNAGVYGFSTGFGYSPGTRKFTFEIGIGTPGFGINQNNAKDLNRK